MLGDGEVVHVEPLAGGPTEVLLVTYDRGPRCVFKPDRDAQTFAVASDRDLVDTKAEIAVHLVSRRLGLDVVPETQAGQVRGRRGMLQRYVEGSKNVSETVAAPRDATRIPAPIVFLDYIVANRDRRQANRLLDPGPPSRELAIDHGFAFSPGTKLEAFLRNVFVFDVPVEIPELPPLYEIVHGHDLDAWAERFATVVSLERARAMVAAARREIETVLASPEVKAALRLPIGGLFDELDALVGPDRSREARARLEAIR